MEELWKVLANLLYLAPLFLLPWMIARWAARRGIRRVWIGVACGVAVGAYIALSGYFLYARLFLAGVAFQLNLVASAFIVATLDVFDLVERVEPGEMEPLIAVATLVQLLLYGCAGGVVGWVLRHRPPRHSGGEGSVGET